jgi:predicted ATP-dependent protease
MHELPTACGGAATLPGAGLTGAQGVIVPRTNVRHLMLKPKVIEAVRAGRFHVFAVGTVEEAVGLLTGTSAGARQADGTFPGASVNRRVEDRLHDMAEAARRLHGGAAMDGSPGRVQPAGR